MHPATYLPKEKGGGEKGEEGEEGKGASEPRSLCRRVIVIRVSRWIDRFVGNFPPQK